ncbi:hypothetical protein QVD17_02547 [Tagetes erecta]|uniref:Uncharacterized protein n=1 Tax=Tagetes erecta TaxID=13708 RepID=A0AAD8LFU4_TARER|nr:hypothetical protein QVD17_02547 [Tagetes erecta]
MFRVDASVYCELIVSMIQLQVELRSGSESSISGDDSFSRETSSSSEIYSDSSKTETSPPPEVTSGRNPATGKYPTAEEIHEFFTVVETKERKRFSENGGGGGGGGGGDGFAKMVPVNKKKKKKGILVIS